MKEVNLHTLALQILAASKQKKRLAAQSRLPKQQAVPDLQKLARQIRDQSKPKPKVQASSAQAPALRPQAKSTGRRSRERSRLGLLRTVDLFSGVGGFTIGAVSAGCPMPHGVEKAPVAVRTARQHGHRVEEMDVGDFGGMESPFGTDLLIGGPPCQPFSPAGSRLGRYDPRDGFKLVYNVIDELSPRRVVFENVPDFLLGKNAAYAKEVLDNLGSRFAAVGVWKLNAKDFGVPQDRERVFIWAAERPMAPPVPTHGPRADQSYKTVRQALPHVAKQAPAILVRNTTAKSRSIDEPSPTVTTRRTLYTATRPGLVYPQPASKQGRILYPEETKILQGFPEFYSFRGTLDQQQIQIGNAVPPALGEAVVSAMTADLIVQPLTPEEVLGRLFAENPSALLVEPREIFDRAIVGVTNLPAPQADPLGSRPLRVVYDYMGMVYAAADDASASAGELDDDEREEFFMEALDWVDRIDFRSAGSNAPEIVRFDDDDPRWE